jgi:hypothetical protein
MLDALRPILARIVATFVAFVCLWLAKRYNIIIPDSDQAKLVEQVTLWVITFFMLIYALVHKLVSAKTNPGDAATPKLALRGKAEQHNRA